jgi:hypothetical protein
MKRKFRFRHDRQHPTQSGSTGLSKTDTQRLNSVIAEGSRLEQRVNQQVFPLSLLVASHPSDLEIELTDAKHLTLKNTD